MEEYISLKKIGERAKKIFQETKLSNKDFCEETGISPATFSLVINGKNLINVDTINKIINRWGDKFNPEWFILGKGELTIDDIDLFDNNKESVYHISKIIEQQQEIESLKSQIKKIENKIVASITIYYKDKSYVNFNPEE